MGNIDIYKNRGFYKDWDWDTDGSIYWRTRSGIDMVNINSFNGLFKLYEDFISNLIEECNLPWLYTIGYELFFTFNNKRYFYLLPSNTIACDPFYVFKLINRLRLCKCSKFYFSEGRLD